MAWTLQVGSRSISFQCSLDGHGLMKTPVVKPIIEMDSYENPNRDGRRHGPVRRRGQVITLEVEARPDHRPVDEVWRELLSVWRADEIRDKPGQHAYLISDTGRRAIGMPVQIEPDQELRLYDTNRAKLEFEAIDDLWYGPEEITKLKLVPEFTGGLPVPAAVPFVLGGGTGVADQMVVARGDTESQPVFMIYGPIQDPWIEVTGVGRLVFRGALEHNQRLVVDTRHWARWVKRDGAPFPGALSPAGARLSDMRLLPGAYRVFFGGYDPTRLSSLEVRVQAAFTSF